MPGRGAGFLLSADAPKLSGSPSCEASASGTGNPRSLTPSRSSSRMAAGGRSLRRRRNPRARIGKRGINASQSSSRSCAVASAAAATAGSSSAKWAASSGLWKRSPGSRIIAARVSAGIVSPRAANRSHAAARRLSSAPRCRRPSRSSNCRNWVCFARSPAARWRSTVARRSSNSIFGKFSGKISEPLRAQWHGWNPYQQRRLSCRKWQARCKAGQLLAEKIILLKSAGFRCFVSRN